MQNALAERVNGLGFSTRVQNVLDGLRIETLAELVKLSEVDLLRSPNLGRKSLAEIHQVLNARGLNLGMEPETKAAAGFVEIDAGQALDRLILKSMARRVRFLEQASRAGCASADILLGRMYLDGLGVRTAFRKARVYFVRAARRGNRLGYWNLAIIYQTGYGVRRSPAKADRWMAAYCRHNGAAK